MNHLNAYISNTESVIMMTENARVHLALTIRIAEAAKNVNADVAQNISFS